MRHKLFAHSEATLAVGQDDYSHEAVIENDGKMVARAFFWRKPPRKPAILFEFM
jgi:hypothetical protein